MATVELIDSVVLGTASTYITFDNIPSTYKDLVVWGNVRQNGTAGFPYFTARFNSTSGSSINNSQVFYHYWSGGSASSGYNNGASGDTSLKLGRPGTSNTSLHGTVGGVDVKAGIFCQFFNYASTSVYKSVITRASGLQKANLSLLQVMGSTGTSEWKSTAAISKIEFGFHLESAGFTAGSNLYLYGINNS